MRALLLAAGVAVCTVTLAARPLEGKNSDFDGWTQPVTLDDAQLGKLQMRAWFSPFQKHSLFRARAATAPPIPCDFAGLRFECLHLKKSIDTPGGERVAYLFTNPVPYNTILSDKIAHQEDCLSRDDSDGDCLGPHFGSAVKTTREPQIPKLEGDVLEQMFKEIDPETNWVSFERVDEVPSGQEALSFLHSLVGRPPPKDCGLPLCSRFYTFLTNSHKVSEGIAVCSINYALGVASLPKKFSCWALAVKSGDDWFILSLMSPEDISSIGAGEEGLFCEGPRSIGPDVMRKAFMAVASASPMDLEMREGETRGLETVVAGHKSGMPSAILQKAGFGKYFETTTFHGTVNADDDRTYVHGDLTIMVHRRSGTGEPPYELNDNESDAYFKEFRRQLTHALSKKLNAEITCRVE
jgi:hypothetical protein